MTAKHRIDSEAKLLITTWEGDITDIKFIQALIQYQKEIQCNPDYVDYNEIFNVRKATGISVKIDGFLELGRVAAKTDHLFVDKKLALVVGSNLAFGLANMYVAYRNMGIKSCKTIRVFKNEDKAYAWAKNNT